jgi:hypothetical protein
MPGNNAQSRRLAPTRRPFLFFSLGWRRPRTPPVAPPIRARRNESRPCACRDSSPWTRGRWARRRSPCFSFRSCSRRGMSSPMVSARQVVAAPMSCGWYWRSDIQRALRKLLAAAENRAVLVKVRRRDVNRLAEMADEIAADVSRAALRTVQKRDATLDAAKDQARAQRRAELAGIARGGEILRLRLVVVIRQRKGNGGERIDDFGGEHRAALTIRRTRASCGATGRLLQRFLDVSFQHSNWSLCNRDANSALKRLIIAGKFVGCQNPAMKFLR